MSALYMVPNTTTPPKIPTGIVPCVEVLGQIRFEKNKRKKIVNAISKNETKHNAIFSLQACCEFG